MEIVQELTVKSSRRTGSKKVKQPKIVISSPVKKAYTFRIYPTRKQEVQFIGILNECRHLYNDSSAERVHQSKINRIYQQFDVFSCGKPEWITYENQSNDLNNSKTEEQKEIYSQVSQNVLKRLDRSFQNFFNGFGYPRFQGRGRYNTFTYPQNNGSFEIKGMKLRLSKIGSIRIFQHREIEGNIKTCTIKGDVDSWYAIFTVEQEKPIIEKSFDVIRKVGIDVGLSNLITLSDGKQIEPPEFLRVSEKKLTKQQRRLSRKVKGSRNRKKQQQVVAKVHRKVRNQRKNFVHKTSTWLVNTYNHIVFEDLQIQNMMSNHRLAKSIADAGWYQLQQFTKYKAEYAGKLCEFVVAKGTSQTCICGCKVPKTLSMRIHKCPSCGIVLDRDHMAAMVIASRSNVPTDCRELMPVESNPRGTQ